MASIAQKAIDVIASLLGLGILIIPCVLQAWEDCDSTQGPYAVHRIDRWKWHWLNAVYGNPEDGVSGRYALVWATGGTNRIPYKPYSGPRWRAYCWSAWRNTADQLKYTFKE